MNAIDYNRSYNLKYNRSKILLIRKNTLEREFIKRSDYGL